MKGRCDVCGKMKEEWETHNYNSGLTRCKEDCSEKELYPNCSEVTWRLNVTSGLTEKEQIVNALIIKRILNRDLK